MRSAADTSTDRRDRLATVAEAAEVLGITPDAVRSRLRRGTLQRSSERGPVGEVMVVLTAKHSEQGDQSSEQSSTDQPTVETVALVEVLKDQVAHLQQQLEEAHRANAEHRRLLAAALERIPEIEAPPEAREASQTPSEEPYGTSPQEAEDTLHRHERSWWQRWFGAGG
jgi:hypothetical protein